MWAFFKLKMAWSIDNVYKFMLYQTDKNQAGSISDDDLFYAWNSQQKMYQSDLLGRWQAQSNGKSGVNTGLIENETILTKLTPFTLNTTLTITAGNATKPAGLVYTLALRINGAKVFKINHDQIWAVNDDVIDPPSVPDDSYYYVEYQSIYTFLPTSPTSVVLDYVKAPTDVVWGFTFDADGRQVYSAGTSVQPEWDSLSIVEITNRTLKSLGVHFKDKDFEQFGQSNIITGN